MIPKEIQRETQELIQQLVHKDIRKSWGDAGISEVSYIRLKPESLFLGYSDL